MFRKLCAIVLLITVTLGCCWAENPGTPIASDELVQAYRQTKLWYTCDHKPHRCISLDYHAQRLVIDDVCLDEPRCSKIKECLGKHIEVVYDYGCFHAPKCADAVGHFNAVRRDQGLNAISLK